MSLINQDIKNLVSGISQQPPILRHPEQMEEQINGFSTEASGLQKRPPTVHLAKLQDATDNKPLVHFIDRDNVEQYCVIFDGDTVRVFGLDGTEYPVHFDSGTQVYIRNNSPRENLKCITIADYTYVVNRTVPVQMSTEKSANYWASQGLLVNIKSGQYGRTYKIEINGETVATYETPDGSQQSHSKDIATDNIVAKLVEAINGKEPDSSGQNGIAQNEHWGATTGSSWLYITARDSSTITSFKVYDGFNNQAAFGTWKTTQKFSNLPASAPDNFVVLVKGEEGSETDDYYIRYDATDNVWKECIKPDITYAYDKATMPHTLVRESDGEFYFRKGNWADRDIGDETSNPEPSFIGYKINDIFFHRNRLGVLAGENVILSRSADFDNFWMTSATKVQDTDPIDLAASADTICTLFNAVPYDEELIVFAQDMQFSLKSANVMTPKDAVLTSAITHYGSSIKAKPVNAGRNIYFVAERALYTTVREFFTAADNTESKDVQDISSHVPSYIPNGVYKIIPSTVENILLFLTEGEENSIYVYKYLFIDGQRQQAAWSKWDMQGKVLGGAFIDSYFYVVIVRNNKLCLERMSFTFNTKDFEREPYRVLLDRKVIYPIPSSSYDEWKDETTVNLRDVYGEIYDNSLLYSVVAYDGTYAVAKDGIVTLNGNYTDTPLTCGVNYLFKITMSTVMVKTQDNVGTSSLIEGRLQLRQFWFNYADSGYFRVQVEMKDKKKTYEYLHTSRVLGTLLNILGTSPFTTGTFKFPVQSWNDNCVITLDTDAPLPISLVGAGWIGNYVRRSRLFQ